MRHAVSKAGRSGQSDQAWTAHPDRRSDAGFAADFFIVLELAGCFDHPAAILVALLFLGGERLAQPIMGEHLRDLISRGLEQANFAGGKLAAPTRLYHQHANRTFAPVLHWDAKKGVIAFLAGFREILVARMTDRVLDRLRLAGFDHHPDQALIDAHRNLADGVSLEP